MSDLIKEKTNKWSSIVRKVINAHEKCLRTCIKRLKVAKVSNRMRAEILAIEAIQNLFTVSAYSLIGSRDKNPTNEKYYGTNAIDNQVSSSYEQVGKRLDFATR